MERECNNCWWYDPLTGVCDLKNELHHGYEDACEYFDEDMSFELEDEDESRRLC